MALAAAAELMASVTLHHRRPQGRARRAGCGPALQGGDLESNRGRLLSPSRCTWPLMASDEHHFRRLLVATAFPGAHPGFSAYAREATALRLGIAGCPARSERA